MLRAWCFDCFVSPYKVVTYGEQVCFRGAWRNLLACNWLSCAGSVGAPQSALMQLAASRATAPGAIRFWGAPPVFVFGREAGARNWDVGVSGGRRRRVAAENRKRIIRRRRALDWNKAGTCLRRGGIGRLRIAATTLRVGDEESPLTNALPPCADRRPSVLRGC